MPLDRFWLDDVTVWYAAHRHRMLLRIYASPRWRMSLLDTHRLHDWIDGFDCPRAARRGDVTATVTQPTKGQPDDADAD